MSFQIRCEQFVLGKLVGVRGARYDLIAKSPEITRGDAFEIYENFNGYRPSATAIASFQNAYVIRRLGNGQTVLLGLARSNEKELGRSYFLQEHYVILSSDDAKKSKVKQWLWLLGLPSAPPSFTKYTELPSHISLSKREIQERVSQAIKLLSTNSDFQRSVITALHFILLSQPIAVSLHKEISSNWTWLTTLSLLMPNTKVAEMELYIGRSLPSQCKADIGIVEEKVNDTSIHYLNFSSLSNSLPPMGQVKRSYTNLSQRCLGANDLQLLDDLIATVEHVDVQLLPVTPTTPLDVLLWVSTIPTLGLQLARKELSKNTLSIDDLQWLWRNSIERFTVDDIKVFFPILVERAINEWENADYISLSKLIKSMPSVITEISIDSSVTPTFLEKWLSYATTFTTGESDWFVSLLRHSVEIDPIHSVILLIKWINKTETDSLFGDVFRIVQLIPQRSVPDKHYWDLVLSLGKNVESREDLLRFREILQTVTLDEGMQPLLRFINLIYADDIDHYERDQFVSILKDVLHSGEEAGHYVGEVVCALFALILWSKGEEALISLAILVSYNGKIQYKQPSVITREIIFKWLDEWILVNNNDALVSSFLYLTSKLGHPELSRRILTDLLHEESERFFQAVKFMLDQLHAQRKDLTISFEDFSSFSKTEQLNLLTKYMLFTEKLPFTSTELGKLEELLVRVDSLNSLSLQYQNWLLNIFQRTKNWHICQRILEHQIRSALLKGRIDQSVMKFRILEDCVNLMEIGYIRTKLSRIRANSIIKYSRALPPQQKRRFFDWLLKAPLSGPPDIEHMFLFLLTSAILENKTEWFVNDPIIRLDLFDEAIQIFGQRYRYQENR